MQHGIRFHATVRAATVAAACLVAGLLLAACSAMASVDTESEHALRVQQELSRLRTNPGDPSPHLELGDAYFRIGNNAAARYHLESYLSRAGSGPDSLRAAFLHARVLLRLGLTQRATRSLRRLAALPQAGSGAAHDLAQLLLADKFPVDAVMAQTRAAEVCDTCAEYSREAARMWKGLGRFDQALQLLGRLRESGRANGEDHFQIGFMRHRLRMPAQAMDAYAQALVLDPHHPEAHYNLALILQQRGDVEGAAYHFEQVLRLRPAFEPTYFDLGRLFLGAGRTSEAADVFRRYLVAGRDSLALHEASEILRDLQHHPGSPAGH